MVKLRWILTIILLLGIPLAAQITVVCAANVQYAMEQIKTAFETSTGFHVKTIYGASGILASQIKNGAPYDVFVSADTEFPDSLVAHGFGAGKPAVYALGTVVLWTAKNIDLTKGLEVLLSPDIRKIAIPDPKRAPYGRAAMVAIRKSGLFDAVDSRLVFGESISQTAQYIIMQSVDIGFNAEAIVLSKDMKGKGHWIELDTALCPKIAQAILLCKYGQNNNPVVAKQFFDFVLSKTAGTILKQSGYEEP